MEGKLILMNGFTQDEAIAIMRAVKAAVENASDIAFATSTPKNLEWKLSDLIKDVRADHEYMKRNPPKLA